MRNKVCFSISVLLLCGLFSFVSASSVESFYGPLLNISISDYELGEEIISGSFSNGIPYKASVGYVNYSGEIVDKYVEIYVLPFQDSFLVKDLIKHKVIVSLDNLTIMRLVRECEAIGRTWNSDMRWNIDKGVADGSNVYHDFFEGEGRPLPANQTIDFHPSYAKYCAMSLSDKIIYAKKLDDLGYKYDFENPDFGFMSLIWGWQDYVKAGQNVTTVPTTNQSNYTNTSSINNSSTAKCTDSDGGKNYTVQGKTTEVGPSWLIEGTDSCASGKVKELYCNGSKLDYYFYDCPFGCKEGVCLPTLSNISCIDSDGGLSYFKKGIASGELKDARGALYTWEDRCFNIPKDAEYLDSCFGENCSIFEFYCQTDSETNLTFLRGMKRLCGGGCKDGACLPEDSSEYSDWEASLLISQKINLNDSYSEENNQQIDSSYSSSTNSSLNNITLICDSIGLRKKSNYCSSDKIWVLQVADGDNCENNFECSSNVCAGGKCVSASLIQKILNWFKNLFG